VQMTKSANDLPERIELPNVKEYIVHDSRKIATFLVRTAVILGLAGGAYTIHEIPPQHTIEHNK